MPKMGLNLSRQSALKRMVGYGAAYLYISAMRKSTRLSEGRSKLLFEQVWHCLLNLIHLSHGSLSFLTLAAHPLNYNHYLPKFLAIIAHFLSSTPNCILIALF